MTSSPFRNASGVNSDDLYDPDITGDGLAAPEFRRQDGSPLRYALAKYGSPGSVLGARDASGQDYGPRWAAKGTASYNDAIVIPFGNYRAESSDSHDAGATFTFTIAPGGTWSIAMTALHTPSGTTGSPLSGNWHKSPSSGVGNDYE